MLPVRGLSDLSGICQGFSFNADGVTGASGVAVGANEVPEVLDGQASTGRRRQSGR